MWLAGLAALRRIPWQVYGVALGCLLVWWHGHREYERGAAATQSAYEQKQRSASDAAQREVDRLDGGADRSRVRQFDRD